LYSSQVDVQTLGFYDDADDGADDTERKMGH
jgi:hypothetical protein